jgi:fructose-bisphosphate aldolase class 1
MEPNLKKILEDLLKQVRDDIKSSHDGIMAHFDTHTGTVNRRISEIAVEELKRDDRATALEATAANFNTSFVEWKPQVEDSIHSVKLEQSSCPS